MLGFVRYVPFVGKLRCSFLFDVLFFPSAVAFVAMFRPASLAAFSALVTSSDLVMWQKNDLMPEATRRALVS